MCTRLYSQLYTQQLSGIHITDILPGHLIRTVLQSLAHFTLTELSTRQSPIEAAVMDKAQCFMSTYDCSTQVSCPFADIIMFQLVVQT